MNWSVYPPSTSAKIGLKVDGYFLSTPTNQYIYKYKHNNKIGIITKYRLISQIYNRDNVYKIDKNVSILLFTERCFLKLLFGVQRSLKRVRNTVNVLYY